MVKKKVVFLSSINFTRQIARDLYVDSIKEAYGIELWDLGIAYNHWIDSELNDSRAVLIRSFGEMENRIQKQQAQGYQILLIMDISENIALKPIEAICKRKNIPMISISKEDLNTWLFESGCYQFRKYYNWRAKIHSLVLHYPLSRCVFNYLYRDGGHKYDYQMASVNCHPKNNKNFLKIHHIKYDEYKKFQNCNKVIDKPYALFIDAGATTHPMFEGRWNKLAHKEYLEYLNSEFEKLENSTGLEIVVALHPKSAYKNGEFGKRKQYIGKTPELICHAEFIIAHYSTSLFTAILMKKPIYIIYYKEMLASAFRATMVMGLRLAELCGANVVEREQKFEIKEVDERQYDSFLKEYVINSEELETKNCTIIRRYLDKIYEEWNW